MKIVFLFFCFCCAVQLSSAQYVQKRTPVRSNLDAFGQALNGIDEQADIAMSYRSGIEKYYSELITKNELSSDALGKLKKMKDESLKRIDDKAEYGDYSRAVDVAEYEYKTVTVAMANVAKRDIDEQNELARKEQQRIYEYTHPFDNFSYAKYSKVINNPSYESKVGHIRITKVALSSSETRVEFKVTNRDGDKCFGWVSIDPCTYIYIPSLKRKIPMKSVQNIAVSPSETHFHFYDEELAFALIFPALPVNVKTFNLIESESSNWKFYNVRIR